MTWFHKGGDDDEDTAKNDKTGSVGPAGGDYDHGDKLERAGKGEDSEEKNIS